MIELFLTMIYYIIPDIWQMRTYHHFMLQSDYNICYVYTIS